ncbi:hypothetical protein ACR34G_02350 [Mycoplasma sp. 480]|uniref:hypothetical protein n=1 Tax=Mycoplasma sp. 480 TaxID=3440155 RepID=UPI003F51988D
MTKWEIKRQEILKAISSSKKLTNKQIALKFKMSERQIIRIKQQMGKNENIESIFQHKNKGHNRNQKFKNEIFVDFIFKYQKVQEEIINKKSVSLGIPIKTFIELFKYNKKDYPCYETIRSKLIENGFVTMYSHRKTKRKIDKKIHSIKKAVKKSQFLLVFFKFINKQLKDEKSNRKLLLKESLKFGEIVEIDACYEYFLPDDDQKIFVYNAIDASTGCLLATHFDRQETNQGYMKLLERVFAKYGKPQQIFSDKRKTFYGTQDSETNLTKEMEKRGIKVISSSVPTHKPNVERSFRNIQQYFPVLFLEYDLKTIDDLNINSDLIINSYNKKYKKIINKENVFAPAKPEEIKIYLPINRKFIAKCFRHNYKFYTLADITEERTIHLNNDQFILCLDSNLDLKIQINGAIWNVVELDKEFSDKLKEQYEITYYENNFVLKAIKTTKINGQSFYRMLDDKVFRNQNNLSPKNIKLIKEYIETQKEFIKKLDDLIPSNIFSNNKF